MPVPRRTFIRRAALAGAAVTLPLSALADAVRRDGGPTEAPGYGPLRPVLDDTTGLPLLHLPEGFRYHSLGWTGDALTGGSVTPGAHDGMAAFAGAGGLIHLVRNHEIEVRPAFDGTRCYDPGAGGGTTTLDIDAATGRVVRSAVSLAGTMRNCAGGPTPWGSWLTCEESVLGPDDDPALREAHGYVFEVPASGESTARPLKALGRFVHEAVAVDPHTGILYQTEDADRAGLYRFVPDEAGCLRSGGRLQMLAVRGRPKADLRLGQITNVPMGIYWVDIEVAAPGGRGRGVELTVFEQGHRRGAATFARLEGAWFADGRLYVTSTSGGNAGVGQVWELGPGAEELRLVYESPGVHELNMPDNLTVSARGGLVLCEDGTANPCVHVLTREGQIARLVRNNVVLNGERNGLRGNFRSSEFAGATFSPDGRWLFVNVQRPGITIAITGPWERGPV